MNIFSLYFRIFILFIYIFIVNNFLAIPFKTINLEYNESTNNYFYKIYTNKIYINITLGTPKQTSKLLVQMEKELFYIHKDGFYHNESSTYKNLDINSKSILTESENKSQDIFYFEFYNSYNDLSNKENKNQKKIYKEIPMNFILMNYIVIWNSKNNKNPGEIGLQYRNINLNDSVVFIKALKETRVINNYIFSFIFNNKSDNNIFNNDGYLIIGEELTDKEDDKQKIKYDKAADRSGLIKWDLIFDEIYSCPQNNITNKGIINKNHQAHLVIDIPYIIGTDEYESFIYIIFFQILINRGVCFEKNITASNDLYGYYCDNSSELFINTIFPDLYFYNREMDETFILKKNDLFVYDINYNNKGEYYCYFLIIFKKTNYVYEKKYWTLGIPFFKKYRFSFDYDKKLIGFYNQSFYFNPDKQENMSPDKDNNTLYNILKIIFIVILIIVLFVLIGFIIKKSNYSKKRKKKLNELVDEDENYEPGISTLND